jgi:multiple sugar transport system substrate-binding protein
MIRRRKSYKAAIAMGAMVMGVSALAGCGSTPTSSGGNTQTTPKPNEAKPSTNEGAGAEKQVNIKFAIWDYGTTDYWAELIAAFESENPTIKVEPIDIPSADYVDKVAIMVASGDDTDVLTIKTMPQYAALVDKSQIVPIDGYIQDHGVDMAPYAGIDETMKMGGNLYGIPFRSDYWLLFYNKGIFDAQGEAYPSNTMTWEEYREVAKRLTTGTGNDKVYGALTHTWLSSVVNWSYTDGEHTLVDGEYAFLKPAYELMLGMQNEDLSTMEWGSLKTANVHYSGPFYKGQAAMVPMGSWFINSVIATKAKGETDIEWGFSQVPHFEGKEAGATIGNVTPMSINSLSKNKEAAWDFIEYLCTEPGATKLASLGTLPAYKTPSILDLLSQVEGFPKECKDNLDVRSVQLEIPPHDQSAAIDKILNEEHELIMLGAISIDEGIQNMNERVQEILKK